MIPLFGDKLNYDLVYFTPRNKASPFQDKWDEHVIERGLADTFFRVIEDTASSPNSNMKRTRIVSAGFWSEKLRILDLDVSKLTAGPAKSVPSFFKSVPSFFPIKFQQQSKEKLNISVSSVLIDDQIGKVFDLEVVDLNGDGKKDLLVTNHQGVGDKVTGSVFAYESPDDGAVIDNLSSNIGLNQKPWKKVCSSFQVLRFWLLTSFLFSCFIFC